MKKLIQFIIFIVIASTLNIQEGFLAAFVHFKLGHAGDRLLIIVNHLIVDGVSWRILIEDLSELYMCLKAGSSPQVSLQKTTAYQTWAKALQKNPIASEIRDFWRDFSRQSAQELPDDFERGENNYASSARYRCVLDHKLTQTLLTQVLEQYEVKINALLLNALSSSLKIAFGLDSVHIDMESHGRSLELDKVDLTRTVGWFTSIYPICLRSLETEQLADKLSHIQNALDIIPNGGDDFLTLRYGKDKLLALSTLKPEISFNYLGQFHNSIFNESIFQMAEEYYGEPVAPENLRRHKLSIVIVVVDGENSIFHEGFSPLHRRQLMVDVQVVSVSLAQPEIPRNFLHSPTPHEDSPVRRSQGGKLHLVGHGYFGHPGNGTLYIEGEKRGGQIQEHHSQKIAEEHEWGKNNGWMIYFEPPAIQGDPNLRTGRA